MSKSYRLSGSALSSEVFADASAAELKVLIAVTELGCIDADELSGRLSIPPSRVRSALTLWLDAGVIAEGEAIPSEGSSYPLQKLLPLQTYTVQRVHSVLLLRDQEPRSLLQGH